MAHIASFVRAGMPLRKFQVSIAGGKDPMEVLVEEQKPFTRKIRRHREKVVELGDGSKVLERPLVELEHRYDFTEDMRSDATRAYNEYLSLDPKKRFGFSTAQLAIQDLGPVSTNESEQQSERSRSKREPVTV